MSAALPPEPETETETPTRSSRKRSGKNLLKKLSWRPTPELLALIEGWRLRQEADEQPDPKRQMPRWKPGRRPGTRWHRLPLTRALEMLIVKGLEETPVDDRLSATQANSIELRLDVLTAQLDDLADRLQTVALLLDALGPSSVASTQAVAAWMACDTELREQGESVEVAEDRILDDLQQVSEATWRLFTSEAPSPPPTPEIKKLDGPDGELLVDSYLERTSARVPDESEDMHWRAEPALARRLEAWTHGRQPKLSRNRAISALVELGLDIAEGRTAVPLHRAAELDHHVACIQSDAASLGGVIDSLRSRVDILGARVTGLPNILVHWMAQHPDFNDGDSEDEDAVDAAEATLLERYWTESEAAWNAVTDAIADPDEGAEQADEDALIFAGGGNDEGEEENGPQTDDADDHGFDEDLG